MRSTSPSTFPHPPATVNPEAPHRARDDCTVSGGFRRLRSSGGGPPPAWAAFEKAAESAKDADFVARNFLNLGYRAWTMGDFAAAEKANRRAEKASPDNPTVQYDLLPKRFLQQPAPGQAATLAIDPTTDRVYPVLPDWLFRVTAPTRWSEKTFINEGRREVKLTSDDAGRVAVLQITALVPPPGFDVKAAANRAADAVKQGGGKVDPLQRLEGKGRDAYWFWAADPSAKPNDPNDYPYLAQLTGTIDGVLFMATLMVRADTPESRGLIPVFAASLATHHLERPMKPRPKAEGPAAPPKP
jgi:hypothetical protein